MRRSAAISAFTRVFDTLWRCAADPGSITVMGPGSAKHRFALHRVRDTESVTPKYSTNNRAIYEMAS
jgi:hypothetical protein